MDGRPIGRLRCVSPSYMQAGPIASPNVSYVVNIFFKWTKPARAVAQIFKTTRFAVPEREPRSSEMMEGFKFVRSSSGQWKTFLRRCLSERSDAAEFGRFATVMLNRHSIPGRSGKSCHKCALGPIDTALCGHPTQAW
ncbi:RNA polymerase II mediator complex subunit Nut1 [Histoplasma capsulatum]|uniref:RNA polymerase II mediator complex subunit Nut1 n=1 Tax=Ajellomyces capsulatus TaxID=5037 RepID=A0A8A1MI27_AJECA|nr:RNA polymerase II mediator complex subunit Nut1 [Histoplasma capsulatum]